MTLPASGALTTTQILAEIGDGYPVTIPNANWRTLAGKPTGSLIMPNDFWGKTWSGGGSPATKSFIANYDSSGTSATISTGTAAASRVIVVAVSWHEGSSHETLSSLKFGNPSSGDSLNIIGQTGHSGGFTGFGVALCYLPWPSGTSEDIFATFTGTVNTVKFGVWKMTNLTSNTPTDSGTQQTSGTSDDVTVTLNTNASGIIIAGFRGSTGASNPSSWTTATEDFAAFFATSGASASGLTSGSKNVTAVCPTITDSGNGLVVASWA